jgi:hypothetical protein
MRLAPNDQTKERLSALASFMGEAEGLPKPLQLSAQWILSLTGGGLLHELNACLSAPGAESKRRGFYAESEWHCRIARSLDPGDAVVSFNYDLVMPIALMVSERLSPSSFGDSPFASVTLALAGEKEQSVRMINPHGSFMWFGDPNTGQTAVVLGRDREETAALMPEGFGSWDKIVLPLRAKKELLVAFPHFRAELTRALCAIAEADEVHLLGKQFSTADLDIAELIRCISGRKQRAVCYADPASEGDAWRDLHDDVFNADTMRGEQFHSLEDYVNRLRPGS